MLPEHDTRSAFIEQLTLEDGRALEVIHLGAAAVPAPPATAPDAAHEADIAAAAADLACCGTCGSDLVQPVDWEEEGPRHWRLELRCPNCEARGTVVVEDAVVDRYDLALERASAALARELHEMVQLAIEEEVGRLGEALDSDLLLPEDF